MPLPGVQPTFYFTFAAINATTGGGGTVNVAIKVPGTFDGINGNPRAGRFLKSAIIWCNTPTDGDAMTKFQIADTDGVIDAATQALIPTYPVILDLLEDTGAGKNVFLPTTGPITIEAFDSSGDPSAKFLPSGLYINLTFLSAALIPSGKVFRGNLRWGKFL